MEWAEARDRTLDLWSGIRRMVDAPGGADELALLTEINALCDLCELAREQASDSLEMCPHCLAYQQFGGCRGINAEMSEMVVAHDWARLRELIDAFIERLRSLELPAAEAG